MLSKSSLQDDLGHKKVFDLVSPMQMLAKLRWESAQLASMIAADDPKAIFPAFNAAATAWHLIDWIVEFSTTNPGERKLDIDEATYRASVVERCPDLDICRQIAVGWKHRVVSQRNRPELCALQVVSLYVRTGSDEVRKARWAPKIFDGNKLLDCDVFFESVTEFWAAELARLKFRPEFTV
jgi:hypothetical protein